MKAGRITDSLYIYKYIYCKDSYLGISQPPSSHFGSQLKPARYMFGGYDGAKCFNAGSSELGPSKPMWFRVQGLRFRVQGLGFRGVVGPRTFGLTLTQMSAQRYMGFG